MALAAQATKRIKIGTGVAIPGTRIAPVTAHSIATINRIAPGRVFLGNRHRPHSDARDGSAANADQGIP
jgi:alkanesulfonate monooxygenase SsuD/methylene tetrahydromethanopterin reductase-like flavin-dependent oxidoreductase (luciferase family)